MEVRDKAHADYVKGMKYKEIAEKYGISVNTIKSWRQRNNWQRKTLKKGAPKDKKGAPFCNTNAVGNRGGPGGPEHNQKAVTHGLFAKYLPPETAELVQAIEKKSPIDILWDNICIKYAAIIRAQKIMYVADAEDVTKRQVMESEEADTYQYTEAYEKQAAFLMAQSRAMGTLNNMIKQYEELCRAGQADEEQQLRIAKLKAEVSAAESCHGDLDDVQIIDDSGDNHEEG
jgi:uncharacterized protein YjcR